jgi:saccharopine dehydrogenase (NAD+, L-lysine-forming)
MTRILILGGYGQTGRHLARHLLERSQAELVLAGRRLAKAQALAETLNEGVPGDRVSARRADAASSESLAACLEGIDLLLVAAPVTEHFDSVVQAALEARVDCVDIQIGAQKAAYLRSRAAEIEQAGLCFVTEAGFHPGLPAALVRHAAQRCEGSTDVLVGCHLSVGDESLYTEAVDELVAIFADYQGQVFEQGAWTPSGSYRTRTIDFGSDIGRRRCYSMFFEELRDLPGALPSLGGLGFFIAGTHWFVDWLISPVVMAGMKLAPRRGQRPLGKLLWWSMQRLARPPHRTVLRVEGRQAPEDSSPAYVAQIGHEDAYALTAIPVVACLIQLLDGTIHRPGLWLMGQVVEPSRLLSDMQAMGVHVSETGGERRSKPPRPAPSAAG